MPTQAQIEEVLANPDKYDRKLVAEANAYKEKEQARQQQQMIPTAANPTVDPISGAPIGGAPGFLANMAPSAMNLGNDLVRGAGQLVSSPIDTLAGMPAGIAEHYGSRYSSPSQAWATFNQDPVGAIMDVVPVGGALKGMGLASKAAGATRAGDVMADVGRTLERMDPVTQAMGVGQLGVGALQNKFGASPEKAMAGGPGGYGAPRGSQIDNPDAYLATIGRAMDMDIPPTERGMQQLGPLVDEAAANIDDVLNTLDQSGMQVPRQELISKLEELKGRKTTSVSAPYQKALDSLIGDLQDSTNPVISQAELNQIKKEYAGQVNYNSAAPNVDRLMQEAYDAGTGVIRETQREFPGVADAMDQYSQLKGVQDVVKRGASKEIAEAGSGFTGDFMAKLLNVVPSTLTGQSKLQRNQARRALDKGDITNAYLGATEQTPYGILRETAYTASMDEEEEKRRNVRRGVLRSDQ